MKGRYLSWGVIAAILIYIYKPWIYVFDYVKYNPNVILGLKLLLAIHQILGLMSVISNYKNNHYKHYSWTFDKWQPKYYADLEKYFFRITSIVFWAVIFVYYFNKISDKYLSTGKDKK